MPSFFPISLFLLLLLLVCAFLPLTSTTATATATATIFATHNRRALHQPFFSKGRNPPTQPPSPQPPSSPKYPFSTTTPNQQPFFPSIHSPPSLPPPSPPAPSSFASFPANISSLVLPQPPKSKPVSSKLVAVAVALVVSAVVITAISIFLFVCRRRQRSFSDSKTSTSDNSNGVLPANPGNANGLPKPRRSPPRSSEFLYLGNIVNSHGGVDANVAPSSGAGGDRNINSRKLDSPELRPLPPLGQESFRQNYANTDVGSGGEEEDEEFYSPRGSSGGHESSIDTGSASRRAFSAVAAENFDARSCESSSSLYSSSNSGSPTRSVSKSISPPASSSPRSSRPKSPELVAIRTAPPRPSPPPPLPPRPVMTQLANLKSSPSPSPPSSSSSERRSEKSLESSPRISNVSIQNAESPMIISRVVLKQLANKKNSRFPSLSSSTSSPERPLEKIQDSSPRISNVSNPNTESPARTSSVILNLLANKKNSRSPSLASSSSPERPLEKIQDSSPSISNVSNPNTESPARTSSVILNLLANKKNSRSPSLASLSSPERPLEKIQDSSPRISNVSNPNTQSPARTSSVILNLLVSKKKSRSPSLSSLSSPEIPLGKTQDSSARISDVSIRNAEALARITSTVQKAVPVSVAPPPPRPPPPPPPPPAPPPPRHWESPVSTPSIRLPILRPPVLVTPSRPVAIRSPTLISPIELPPSSENAEKNEETLKPKLKPLHWDKVRASSDREMVWDQLKSSSFKVNEEMIETLFVVNTPNSNPKESTRRVVLPSPVQENSVLDPKKAQNIAISLRALNVTIEEVCEALSEGNADALGTELLESLMKMAPTKEEERRLKEYKDDSPFKLGPAERFLKAVLDIPFAFKRVDAMLYIANFESEVEYLKKSFETLEGSCEELRNSRMFLKLLEAVLKTGNRMNVGTNRGDAQAFKLDTLLKLVDVKGADGKTTLLHFVVQEITRSEGARLSGDNQSPKSTFNDDAKCRKLGLQVVSGLCSELTNVKNAAAMDSDVLSGDVMKLSKGIGNIAEVIRLNEATGMEESSRKFSESMNRFMKMAEAEILRIQAHESVALSLVKEITEYFHGNSAKEEAHPFRIFMVVRDFLTVLDRVCKEVGMINERTIVSSAHKFPVPVNPTLQPVVSGFPGRQQYSSSDDESSSP